MTTNSAENTSKDDHDASTTNNQPSPKKGLKILRRISRKKYQVSSDPNAWKKRGCFYTGAAKKISK
ncbi:MAG: hypothetical protein AAFZ63_19940 [Bacteroidota bacterium]